MTTKVCPNCHGTGVELGWGGCYRCENTGEWRKPKTTADAFDDFGDALREMWTDIRKALKL